MALYQDSFLVAFWIATTCLVTNIDSSAGAVVMVKNSFTPAPKTNTSVYAWSSWGAWGACSRTCGGGVAVQERHCLPRDTDSSHRTRRRRKLIKSHNVRLKRSDSISNLNYHRKRSIASIYPNRNFEVSSSGPDCPGLGRRYHECNTAPCPGPEKDSRAAQCSIYNRRPFRGQYYTWVPYVDGNSPCTLNCRPLGQQFYASLALAADGTPCTRPGYRAICVQGTCKVVGREGVLSTPEDAELECGRRLVSGLFSRTKLPLGYSHVTTVPRGACRLNVSEIAPSANYIAVKVTNGSYIVNGDFAISSPGAYDAVGSRFQYMRVANVDRVLAAGPLHKPVEIMILYTEPNPKIKYEYFIQSEEDEQTNDVTQEIHSTQLHPVQRHHRHHSAESHTKALKPPFTRPQTRPTTTAVKAGSRDMSVAESRDSIQMNVIGDRKFLWKVMSFSQCSRSCGGGLQIGKFKCVEIGEHEHREVSPSHCSGAPPPTRRRRCGTNPCPPRWRAAAWGPCPVCGPAQRTRIVGCVQDHARGITKISDQKCPLPMPPSSEACNIPNCDSSTTTPLPRGDPKRQVRPKDRIDHFRDSPAVISSTYNTSEREDKTKEHEPTNYSYTGDGGWLYTEWSECAGWCLGGGVQSRRVRCSSPRGCDADKAPKATQPCVVKKDCDAMWFTGEWSSCTANCEGVQVRTVICIGGSGRRLRDSACRAARPAHEQSCGGACYPSWYLSDWSECTGACESGVQSRTVWCARGGAAGAGGAAHDAACSAARPHSRRACVPPRCSSAPPHHRPANDQPRFTRNQNNRLNHPRDQKVAPTNSKASRESDCEDRLNNCALAVQARLCHYPYYVDYCCRSCHSR